MGKNKHYADDYTGDVRSIRKSHKKFRVLLSVLCVSGVIAAGSATYVLMNPAQTMTKEGIDEMDPNEDFVVVDEDAVLEDIIPAEDLGEEEDLDAIPLIEEADEDEKAPADTISAADDADASKDAADAALPGTAAAEEDALPVEAEETESELPEEMQAAADVTAAVESEAPAADVTAAGESEAARTDEAAPFGSEAEEIIGTAEPEEGQSAEASDPEETADLTLEESGETVVEEVQSEALAGEEVQTEPAAAEAEIAEEESEEAIAGEEAVQTEEAAQPEEIAETELSVEETEAAESESEEAEAAESESEEPAAESGTETAEPETQASEIREKSKDEVYVETEGERLDAKWIDSVGLEIRTESGWNTAQTEGGAAIEVDADQTLRFRVTYTVQPGTLSSEMRTLIYQIPQEITKVDESYGEIVDANDQVLANYAIDETGLIRVTFMEDIAERNEAGTKVTCQIEFRTKASNLVQ